MRRKNTAVSAFTEALTVMNQPLIWVPPLVYLGLKIGLLLLYRATFLGPAGHLWALALPGDTRSTLVHYPWDLVHMPLVLGRFGIVVYVFVGVVFQGATMILFADALRDKPLALDSAFRATRARYVPIVAVAFISAAVLVIVLQVPALVGSATFPGAPKLAGLLAIVAKVVVPAFFLYALPYVLLMGRRFGVAIGSSFRWTRRAFPQTVVLVLVPFLVTVPTMLLRANAKSLAKSLTPESVILVEVANEIALALSMVLLAGGLTIWFVRRKGRELVV